jgi:thiol-disulfide isomerase/thioredoxin
VPERLKQPLMRGFPLQFIGYLLLLVASSSADSLFESLARQQVAKLREMHAKAPSQAPGSPEFAAWQQELDRLQMSHLREVLLFVEQHPREWDAPAALFYAVSLVPGSEESSVATARLDQYLDHPSLAAPLLDEGRYATPERLEWIARVESTTKSSEVRSAARIALAKAFLQSNRVERARELLQACLEEPELKIGGSKVRDLVEGPLFEANHLQVGMSFPTLRGEDVQGAALSLDDYQGKVLLLEFWASWCAPSRRMLPENRALLEKYASKGFALVGINGDQDRDAIRKFEKENRIAWNSFWQGPEMEISRRFNQTAWPTIYLMDRQGVIRFRDLRGEDLERAVATLLCEP